VGSIKPLTPTEKGQGRGQKACIHAGLKAVKKW